MRNSYHTQGHVAVDPPFGRRRRPFIRSNERMLRIRQTSGLYFYRNKPETPSAEAQDDAAAARLWDESARLEAAVPQPA